MLRILGSANPFRDGSSRREAMQVGALGALSLGLPELWQLQAAQGAESAGEGKSFGKAKQILMIYLQGAATQHETWDPKPDAPKGIRGEFGAAATTVPGVHISGGLPKIAKLMDRIAVVRSMTHKYNNHSNHYTLTGYPTVNFPSETNPFDSRHHPFFGSVLDYLADRRRPGKPPPVPRNIGLPWKFSNFSPVFRRSGPYGAFLGQGYDPVWTEFDGKATKTVQRSSFFRRKDVAVKDPFLGITPESRVRISKDARMRNGLTIDRLDRRRSLLEQLEAEKRRFESTGNGRSVNRFREMAFSLMTSQKLKQAMDVGKEPASLRAKYGMNLFGQSCLTARRLLEAGCGLVSVFWDEYRIVNTAWDTHSRQTSRLRDELHPGLDAGISSLLQDLESRGLMEETLVMCLTEHGRTPKLNKGGSRDHWSNVYSIMLAGAGIPGGTVVGSSDKHAGFVKSRPVSPEDILATMYHLKGINPETTIPDRLNRPVRLVANGKPVSELLR